MPDKLYTIPEFLKQNGKLELDGYYFLLFDVGDTLISSFDYIAGTWDRTLSEFGLDPLKFLKVYPSKLFIDEGAFCNQEKMEYVFGKLSWDFTDIAEILSRYQENYRYLLHGELRDDPNGTFKFLDKLKNDYRLGILSDNSIVTKNEWLRALEKNGFENIFEFFITSEEVGAWKPDKKMFKEALELMGGDRHEAIYFGDNLERDTAAYRHGMQFCYVTGFKKSVNTDDLRSYLNLPFINSEYIISS